MNWPKVQRYRGELDDDGKSRRGFVLSNVPGRGGTVKDLYFLREQPEQQEAPEPRHAKSRTAPMRSLFYRAGHGERQRTTGSAEPSWSGRRIRPAIAKLRPSREGFTEWAKITGYMWLSVVPALGMSIAKGDRWAFGTQIPMVAAQAAYGLVTERWARGDRGKQLFRKPTRKEAAEPTRLGLIATVGLGAAFVAKLVSGSSVAGFTAAAIAAPVQGIIGVTVNRVRDGRLFARRTGRDVDEFKRWVGIGTIGTGGTAAAQKWGGGILGNIHPALGQSAGFVVATALAPVQGAYSAVVNGIRRRQETAARDGSPQPKGLGGRVVEKTRSWWKGNGTRGQQPDRGSRPGKWWTLRRAPAPMTPGQARTRATALKKVARVDAERARDAWRRTEQLEERAAKLHSGGKEKRDAGREKAKQAKDLEQKLGQKIKKESELAKGLKELTTGLGGEVATQGRQLQTSVAQEIEKLRQAVTATKSEATRLDNQGKAEMKQASGWNGLYAQARREKAKKLGKVAKRSGRRAGQAIDEVRRADAAAGKSTKNQPAKNQPANSQPRRTSKASPTAAQRPKPPERG